MLKVQEEKVKEKIEMDQEIERNELKYEFNVVKGQEKERKDVKDKDLDECGKKEIEDVKEEKRKGNMIG